MVDRKSDITLRFTRLFSQPLDCNAVLIHFGCDVPTKGFRVFAITGDKAALIVKAWNLYRTGGTCETLQWSPSGKFPKPV